eukprot:TRINITY_DN30563_c0_g1_i1.p1 TRINITY_DN30563_c0_g1~~TRINITY_DN30563_c0_g1_i1.p1  ORF type:complete len:568 (+),score=247.65 TRINITY_DN30563_c0_g1_i1:101-1705(+)
MPTKPKTQTNKLHQIRQREARYNQGEKGMTSYFTPSLVEICAKVVADTFPDQSRIESVLRDKPAAPEPVEGEEELPDLGGVLDGEKLLNLVTFQLSTDLPLDVCVQRVTSEAYWRARCEAQWPPPAGQLPAYVKYRPKDTSYQTASPQTGTARQLRSDMEPDWKRTYLERHIEEFAMSLDEEEDPDSGSILEKASQITPEKVTGMRGAEILEVLCRLAPERIFDIALDRQRAHLDWVSFCSWLPNLRSFRVTFAALDVGMHFRMNMFGIRKSDIVGPNHDAGLPPQGLVKVLRDPHCNIYRLSLPENQIDDERTKGLLLGLIKNTSVEVLDLSHNKISDDGAKALATLLMRQGKAGQDECGIKHLDLADNLIGMAGGKALGRALSLNSSLRYLSLKLNHLTDEGGLPILVGVKSNESLNVLNLSNNELASQSVEALADTLKSNVSLEELYLAGNHFAEEGGKLLLDAVKLNDRLTHVDVRRSGVAEDDMDAINVLLKQRTDGHKRTYEEQKEEILRAETELAVRDWKERFYQGE